MGQTAQLAEAPPLVETTQTPDIFATELAEVERVGNCVRFILACQQTGMDGTQERVVVCRVVMPMEAVPPGIRKTIARLMLGGFPGSDVFYLGH